MVIGKNNPFLLIINHKEMYFKAVLNIEFLTFLETIANLHIKEMDMLVCFYIKNLILAGYLMQQDTEYPQQP